MSEEIKLEPCPFCGSANIEVEFVVSEYSYGCDTQDCYGFQSITTFKTKEQAAAHWNRRVPSAADLIKIVDNARIFGLLSGALSGCHMQVDAELKSRIEPVLKEADDFNRKYFKK